MVFEKVSCTGMNSSSKSLVLIVAGATTVAATLGVTLGAIQAQKSPPTVSSQPIAPTATLAQTPPTVVSSIALSTTKSIPPLASVTPQPELAIAQTLQRETCTRANMAIVNDPNRSTKPTQT